MKKTLISLLLFISMMLLTFNLNASTVSCKYTSSVVTGNSENKSDVLITYKLVDGTKASITGCTLGKDGECNSFANVEINDDKIKSTNFYSVLNGNVSPKCPKIKITIKELVKTTYEITSGESSGTVYKKSMDKLEINKTCTYKTDCGSVSIVTSGSTVSLKSASEKIRRDSSVTADLFENGCPDLRSKTSGGFCTLSTKTGTSISGTSGQIGSSDGNLDMFSTSSITCENLIGENGATIVKIVLIAIRIAVPVILIALTASDFMKAIPSQDNDAIVKSWKKFGTRGIIAVIIMLLPTMLNIIGSLSGAFDSCGIW